MFFCLFVFANTPYNEGNYFLHCSAPYYDANGNFAGGVGAGAEVDYLYKALVDFNSDEPMIGIIVNQNGKIVMSSEKDGLFAVGDKDMRLYEYDKLAEVFKKMTALENDIVSLTLNDKKYYVAFAPIRVANWSFGTIIENKAANAASEVAKEKILAQMDDFKKEIGHIFLVLMVFSLISIVVMLAFLLRLGIRESDKDYGFATCKFKDLRADETVPQILKLHCLFAPNDDFSADDMLWVRNYGERRAMKGGMWGHSAGMFGASFAGAWNDSSAGMGFRCAFIDLEERR